MKETYGARPVTDQEIADITAFLTAADKTTAAAKSTSNVGNYLLTGGVAGIILLLVLFTLFWINRKNKTVNLAIYKRQIKSA